jgi:acetyl esterase/lipase
MKLTRRVVLLDRLRRRVNGSIVTWDQAGIDEARGSHLPSIPGLDPLVQRFGLALFGRPSPGVVTRDRMVPGADGEVRIRVHTPIRASAPPAEVPLIVHLHGGGWVVGSPQQYDVLCTRLADELQAVVASIDYRMAPEHPAPAAVDDAIAVTRWLAEHGGELGAAGPVAVVGDSAGGNLAALVAIAARDGRVPPVLAQVLIYPATDLTMGTPSARHITSAPILGRADMEAYVGHYLAAGVAADDPRVSPFYVDDLAGVAPALVITAEHDPLLDEGVAYAQRLADAGTPVRQTTYVGVPHGFLSIPGACPVAHQATAEIVTFLRGRLAGPR